MKRSKINQCIKEMEQLAEKHGFVLPPFCNWTPDEWETKSHEYDEIRDNMLGWDITDYGLGDFDKVGFALVTIRNGNQNHPKYKKVYAEKLLMLKEGTGDVLIGEVSMCNDDNTDNRFYEEVGRFPEIEEDEAPYRFLCNEYPKAK